MPSLPAARSRADCMPSLTLAGRSIVVAIAANGRGFTASGRGVTAASVTRYTVRGGFLTEVRLSLLLPACCVMPEHATAGHPLRNHPARGLAALASRLHPPWPACPASGVPTGVPAAGGPCSELVPCGSSIAASHVHALSSLTAPHRRSCTRRRHHESSGGSVRHASAGLWPPLPLVPPAPRSPIARSHSLCMYCSGSAFPALRMSCTS